MFVESCIRCHQLKNKVTKEWEEADNTIGVINNFNNNQLLPKIFGPIVFKDAICSECRQILPTVTVNKFKKMSSRK
ncbi:hypothetical protein COT98_03450 [Candidatus Falkowbacteria bacterium CG10_big_fil_rev_8_21_14_0_10_39_9]|uniref:Uncharacterized protein n=1 Tax=Candidatus Falkowbacteria bacterium CG10_big_fil_rev_8_21_14_0_10_39_9 TaxID=1974566 RepID=A0A2M6WNU5_9BACT|nr:MAG: hypothetical protein COT98_03450 [Candidatus Falkowbacteria bacterium CG10_big_fil_rev_8_21_14_0_10_39_9]